MKVNSYQIFFITKISLRILRIKIILQGVLNSNQKKRKINENKTETNKKNCQNYKQISELCFRLLRMQINVL